MLSSLRMSGEMAPLVFSGTLNGDFFKVYIADCLAPMLSSGDIVVMDNLSSHKVDGIIDPILEKGATVLFLPPYSPDFNPIEMQ
ncbi:MAG: transposase [Candidatus Accumulibacter sp.]|nr:transposase [Accumulibacter sp.]